MRIILVDDEPLALDYLEDRLNKFDGVNIIGKYINPHEAIVAVLRDKPDVIFLDIEIPEINGIELAEIAQQSLPEIHLVFVTAFNEYAVKAFDLNAIDYVIKPVQHDRLHETLSRISKVTKDNSSLPASTHSPIVCAFQLLSFARSDDITKSLDVRWRTSKVRGVFIFLLQHRGTAVQKDTLLETFWPDIDLEKGLMQLYSAIYQVRKTISSINFNIIITNYEGGYRLDLNDVKFDVDEWKNGLKKSPVVTSNTLSAHKKLLDIYRGDYLAADDYLWAENEREHLRILWLQHISNIADFLEAESQYTEAISLYLRMQMAQPYAEHSYFKLLQLYSKLDNIQSVEQQYKKLKKMLLEEYDAKPGSAIQTWYDDWVKSRNHQRLEI